MQKYYGLSCSPCWKTPLLMDLKKEVDAPLTSLGSMCSEALSGLKTYPYRLFIPAVILSVMILSLNLFGDGLRDALDPKLKK